MEFGDAVQVIALLIAAWSLYLTRQTSQPLRPQKKSPEASIACLQRMFKKKPREFRMLTTGGEKKSDCATASSRLSKKAHEVHTACNQKKRFSDTRRIDTSKKRIASTSADKTRRQI